jgi:hypothetical protein
MSENQTLSLTDQVENKNFIEENEELEAVEVSDDEVDEYFEHSKSLIVDGLFNIQGSTFSARYWHTRWSNDVAHLSRMGKALTSANAIKKLTDDQNAKALAELWCVQTPMAVDIENFLKKHPIDNVWYFISILAQIEKKGMAKGEKIERAMMKKLRTEERSKGGKKTSEVNPLSQAMREVKDHWEAWQAQAPEIKLGTAVAFAERMVVIYGSKVTFKNITDNCTKWKKEKLLQISNPFG